MFLIEIVINSTRVMGIRVNSRVNAHYAQKMKAQSCRYCIVFMRIELLVTF